MFVGPDEGMMDTVAKIIKGKERMHMIGAIRGKDKIAEMYQAADVYVLPSYREGLPLTLFEAMAAGLPIVASPVNGVPYEMKEPENGLFVRYGDLKGLKRSILQMLDDKEFARKVSANNRKKASNYNWDIITQRTKKIYEEVIEKRKGTLHKL
jgi:glycosyltransferase involved in cell wall biosynthesis